MDSISLDIDNKIINIFSSESLDKILKSLNLDSCYELKQIHSAIPYIVDEHYINNQEGDALITNIPNKPIIIKVADCIPILLYDEKRKVIAVVHSGWKGTLDNIVGNTINMMKEKFKSQPLNINAYIYPSIRNCHFEIEKDVYSLFENKIKNIDKYTIYKGQKYYIDLQSIIKDELNKLGIIRIIDTNICTYCNHEKYHSYRYNHTDKRNILLTMIKE